MCGELGDKFKTILDKLCITADNKHYLRQLENANLTSARNILLEVMLQEGTLTKGQAISRTVDTPTSRGLSKTYRAAFCASGVNSSHSAVSRARTASVESISKIGTDVSFIIDYGTFVRI